MEIGVVVSLMDSHWMDIVADARHADESGLDSVCVMDHLMAPRGARLPLYEAWTSLAAIGAATNRIRVGHLVGCSPFRNIGVLAKSAVTVDHATEGRLELGLGAGWFEDEFRAFTVPLPEAGARRRLVAETIDALSLLFTGEPTSFAGEFVQLEQAVCQPPPIQRPRPPITVGANGPLMLRLAGEKADGWNCSAKSLPDLDKKRELVVGSAGQRSVKTTANVPFAVGESVAEASRALALAEDELSWMGDLRSFGVIGTVERAADRVQKYVGQGVDGIQCQISPSSDHRRMIELMSTIKGAVG